MTGRRKWILPGIVAIMLAFGYGYLWETNSRSRLVIKPPELTVKEMKE